MKQLSSTHEKMNAALQILQSAEISISNFENLRILVKGLHPEIDKKLAVCSKALDTLQKIQQADVISLTAENLPEETEKQKKRKKALLFFINSIKDLQSEIKRVQLELHHTQGSNQSTIASWGRIVKFAKGPFGLITLGALIVVGVSSLVHQPAKQAVPAKTVVFPTAQHKKTMQVILYNTKQLPLSQLYIGTGADCDSPHYHAINGSVMTLDGTTVVDPEGCGFGKVKDTQVVTVEQ